mgnify:CR=1 FL=1|tara:strand:- start:337 stop:654 length:318 start_codon:yes stop_codon:yes gene_type:complete
MDWKEFFKPNKWKISYFFVPLLMAAISYILVRVQIPIISKWIGVPLIFLFYYLSMPFQFILKPLGMTSSGGWFTNLTPTGMIFVAIIYGLLLYLLEAFMEHKKGI